MGAAGSTRFQGGLCHCAALLPGDGDAAQLGGGAGGCTRGAAPHDVSLLGGARVPWAQEGTWARPLAGRHLPTLKYMRGAWGPALPEHTVLVWRT